MDYSGGLFAFGVNKSNTQPVWGDQWTTVKVVTSTTVWYTIVLRYTNSSKVAEFIAYNTTTTAPSTNYAYRKSATYAANIPNLTWTPSDASYIAACNHNGLPPLAFNLSYFGLWDRALTDAQLQSVVNGFYT